MQTEAQIYEWPLGRWLAKLPTSLSLSLSLKLVSTFTLSLLPSKTSTWLYFLKELHLSYTIILVFQLTLLCPLFHSNKGYLEIVGAAKDSAAILLYIQNPIV